MKAFAEFVTHFGAAKASLLDRRPTKPETGHVHTRLTTKISALLVSATLAFFASGCSSMLFFGGPETSSIVYTNGELRSTEETSPADLVLACEAAIKTLGYDLIESTREIDRMRWQARTAGGDGVEIQLIEKSRMRSELRIRIGVIGDEARSRLVLEQIQQSL